jgi:hypothetical protein
MVQPCGSGINQGKPPIFIPKAWDYKPRKSSSGLMKLALSWSEKLSSGWFYLFIGIVGTSVMLPSGRDPRLLLITAICLPVLLATWFGVMIHYYKLPFEPIFTMFFCFGAFAIVAFLKRTISTKKYDM